MIILGKSDVWIKFVFLVETKKKEKYCMSMLFQVDKFHLYGDYWDKHVLFCAIDLAILWNKALTNGWSIYSLIDLIYAQVVHFIRKH